MSDRRSEIDPRFYRGDRKPVATTVLELRELLSELPDDLPVMPHESGAALIVYNVTSSAFLSIEEADDWEQDDE